MSSISLVSSWIEQMALIEVNWRPGHDELRKFGCICFVVFGGLGMWLFFRESVLGVTLDAGLARKIAIGLWVLAAGSLVLSQISPRALRPLFVILTALSFPIGFVISHVLMALLYYGVLTPVAIFFRLIGRDVLHRRFDREALSYWEPRRQTTPDRYFRQF